MLAERLRRQRWPRSGSAANGCNMEECLVCAVWIPGMLGTWREAIYNKPKVGFECHPRKWYSIGNKCMFDSIKSLIAILLSWRKCLSKNNRFRHLWNPPLRVFQHFWFLCRCSGFLDIASCPLSRGRNHVRNRYRLLLEEYFVILLFIFMSYRTRPRSCSHSIQIYHWSRWRCNHRQRQTEDMVPLWDVVLVVLLLEIPDKAKS